MSEDVLHVSLTDSTRHTAYNESAGERNEWTIDEPRISKSINISDEFLHLRFRFHLDLPTCSSSHPSTPSLARKEVVNNLHQLRLSIRICRSENLVHDSGGARSQHEGRKGTEEESEAGEDCRLDDGADGEAIEFDEEIVGVIGDRLRRYEIDRLLRFCVTHQAISSQRAREGNEPGNSRRI